MKRVIISGGGTGGHIFPAIAIATALRSKVEGIDILFIGARGRMEMEKVPAAGFRIEGLPISGFQRRLTWKNLTFPFKLVYSMVRARSIIADFKPDVVIGVGGYASGPTLRMAASMGIPTLIQEQNSFPGVTNKLLGNRVQRICVAYEEMTRYFPAGKIVMTGNPVRQDVVNILGKEGEAFEHFGLLPGRITLLVIGGSLGARTINQAITKYAGNLTAGQDIQVLWQTGKFYYNDIKSFFDNSGSFPMDPADTSATSLPHMVILPFIDRMDLAYAAADIIISRAGAIAISELSVVGKPVILVPSPNVAEDHQTKNARSLADRKAAIMVRDIAAVETLGTTIHDLLNDPQLQADLSRNIRALGISDAAEIIANVALSLTATANDVPGKGSGAGNPPPRIIYPETVYFLGIGGIGMSALARYFKHRGAIVSGYDRTPTNLTVELGFEGIDIHFVEDPSKIPVNPGLVVYTPAIPAGNREFVYLKSHGIPLKKRAEVLGMIAANFKTIAVAGTHGKTTTSSLVAHILSVGSISQIAFLGGVSKNYGTNFLYEIKDPQGKTNPENDTATPQINIPGDSWCVAEADEYDKSFLQLTPTIAIITSADADHLDIYGSHGEMKKSFSDFTGKIVSGGSLIMKKGVGVVPDHRNNYSIYDYSVSSGASFHAQNVRVSGGLFHFDLVHPGGLIPRVVMGLPGRFNLENAVAAMAAGILAGVSHEDLRSALLSYQGVQRRFDFRIRRDDLVYIDDYAHHPAEITACITAVRELFPGKKITGIFQPHLFTRTRDLAGDFAKSLGLLDELILLDIYPAREKPIEGVTSQILLDLVGLDHKKLVQKGEILHELSCRKPEVLLTLGAGDIDQLAGPITELLSATAN